MRKEYLIVLKPFIRSIDSKDNSGRIQGQHSNDNSSQNQHDYGLRQNHGSRSGLWYPFFLFLFVSHEKKAPFSEI